MAPSLREQVDAIETRDDLYRFIERMRSDLKEHRSEWAHTRLDSYLEAMAAWVKAIENLEKNTGQDFESLPKYRLIGRVLLAPKFYE